MKTRTKARAGGVEPRGRVSLDDGTTCVLIPVDDYERLLQIAEAHDLAAKLEDPHAGWVDFDDYKVELAANRIAEARKARGLTQVQLSRKLGLPQSQVSRIERHPDRTTVRTLKRIAAALGVDVKRLVE